MALAACTTTPGTTAGATTGAVGGALVGGPVGAVVGGAAGAVVGGIAEASAPRFRTYVVEQRVPSYTYDGDVAVGVVLPEQGVTLYDVPPEYNVTTYKYAMVNDRVVLVDPSTRRIVQVIG
jgi:hypothetical protein